MYDVRGASDALRWKEHPETNNTRSLRPSTISRSRGGAPLLAHSITGAPNTPGRTNLTYPRITSVLLSVCFTVYAQTITRRDHTSSPAVNLSHTPTCPPTIHFRWTGNCSSCWDDFGTWLSGHQRDYCEEGRSQGTTVGDSKYSQFQFASLKPYSYLLRGLFSPWNYPVDGEMKTEVQS